MKIWITGIVLGLTVPPAFAGNVCDAYKDIVANTSSAPSQRTLIGLYAAGTATGVWAGAGYASNIILRTQANALTSALKKSILATGLPDAISASTRAYPLGEFAEFEEQAARAAAGGRRAEIAARSAEQLSKQLVSRVTEVQLYHRLNDFHTSEYELERALTKSGVSAEAVDEVKFYLKNISPADQRALVETALKRAGVTPTTTVGEALAKESAEAFSKKLYGVLADEVAQHAAERAVLASPVLRAEGVEIAAKLANTVIRMEGGEAVVFRTVTPGLARRTGQGLALGLGRAAPVLAGVARVAAVAAPIVDIATAIDIIYDSEGRHQKALKERTQTSNDVLGKYFQELDEKGFCSRTASVSSAEGSMIMEIDQQIKAAMTMDVRLAQMAGNLAQFESLNKGPMLMIDPVIEGKPVKFDLPAN